MSIATPKLELINKAQSQQRFEALLFILQDQEAYHLFRGFDRPVMLIKRYRHLGSNSLLDLPQRLFVRRAAQRFMHESDQFFSKDIELAEAWVVEHIEEFNQYIATIPQLTFVPWNIIKIYVLVHTINDAFACSNGSTGTIILGIRPPETRENDRRLYLLVHELVHLNLTDFVRNLPSSSNFEDAPAEMLAIYYTYTLLQKSGRNTSIAKMEWLKHQLSEMDFKIFTKTLSNCGSQTDIKSVFAHNSIQEILSRYRPQHIFF